MIIIIISQHHCGDVDDGDGDDDDYVQWSVGVFGQWRPHAVSNFHHIICFKSKATGGDHHDGQNDN